jgi:hypothetical protein
MITYEWQIEQLESYPTRDGFKNVVCSIFWRCNAQEDSFSATSYGSVGVELNKDDAFIPYADLTNDMVVNWVQQTLGEDKIAEIKLSLAETIDAKKTPKSVVGPPPWLPTLENT